MSTRGETRALLREARRQGAEVRHGKGAHMKVYVKHRLVTVMSYANNTECDLMASRRALRKAGLDL